MILWYYVSMTGRQQGGVASLFEIFEKAQAKAELLGKFWHSRSVKIVIDILALQFGPFRQHSAAESKKRPWIQQASWS